MPKLTFLRRRWTRFGRIGSIDVTELDLEERFKNKTLRADILYHSKKLCALRHDENTDDLEIDLHECVDDQDKKISACAAYTRIPPEGTNVERDSGWTILERSGGHNTFEAAAEELLLRLKAAIETYTKTLGPFELSAVPSNEETEARPAEQLGDQPEAQPEDHPVGQPEAQPEDPAEDKIERVPKTKH